MKVGKKTKIIEVRRILVYTTSCAVGRVRVDIRVLRNRTL